MKIRFSHIYQKLLDQHNDCIESAKLLDVQIINLENISQEFLNYDTDNGKYQLSGRGKHIMLFFLKPREDYVCSSDLFTSIRRWSEEKEKYYRGLIGKSLDNLENLLDGKKFNGTVIE